VASAEYSAEFLVAVAQKKLTEENRVLLSNNLKQVMDKIDQVVIKVIKNPKVKKVLLLQNSKMMVVDLNNIV
tara:strand:+ start:288 stop:503 length:216 start_codon:yes stop_codon:yes gene_type:complete